ncbi:hypothetical protein [Paenibacillus sp. N3.4]|uniref:hypothetical protein n=1 Tax=Paenibacillus sp. N3.4 TaxID=2603222 RepID=UPI00164F21C3|nr:hypothetical protein [Paenibacillus sp. N3.4]
MILIDTFKILLGMDIHICTRDGNFTVNGYAKLKCFTDFKTEMVTVHLTDFATDPIGLNAKQGWVFYYESVPASTIEIHHQYTPLFQISTQEFIHDSDWKVRFKTYLDQTYVQIIEILNACQLPNEKNQMVALSSFATFQISNIQYVD